MSSGFPSASLEPASGRSAGRIGAVMVNHDGGECVIRAIRALLEQSLPPDSIVVADNGSADGSPERIARTFPNVEVIRLRSNIGLPAARNIGLSRCESARVLLLDDDVYLDRHAVRRLVRTAEVYQAAVVCPRIRLLPERTVVQCDGAEAHFIGTMRLRHGYRPVQDVRTVTSDVGGSIGACMLLDRRSVIEAGGFDERYFFYLEDHEFGLRLRGLGHRIVCEPRAVAFHDRGEGTAGLSFRGRGDYPERRAYLTSRHRLRTLLLHYRLRTLVVLAPALVLHDIASLIGMVARGWGGAWWRSHVWQLRNARETLRRRRWIQRRRVRRDRDLLVGGPLPVAPGFLSSRREAVLFAVLETALDVYWKATRWLTG